MGRFLALSHNCGSSDDYPFSSVPHQEPCDAYHTVPAPWCPHRTVARRGDGRRRPRPDPALVDPRPADEPQSASQKNNLINGSVALAWGPALADPGQRLQPRANGQGGRRPGKAALSTWRPSSTSSPPCWRPGGPLGRHRGQVKGYQRVPKTYRPSARYGRGYAGKGR
jgi:hypothetical protein